MPADFSLSAADVAVIAVSLGLTLGVGLWAGRRREETAQAYFLASGRLPWWIIGSAFVSTSVSSEQIVGTVGAAYAKGMAIANWEWFTLPMYAPLILFFVPVYLRSRVTTIPDFLNRRFGAPCGDLYSWVMLAAYTIVFLVPVVYSGALAVSSLTGWNFSLVAWAMVALVGAYAVKGGLASVMWTDALQCVMLVGGGVLLYLVALDHIPGGWTAMAAANPERFHLYRPAGDPDAPFLGLVCGAFGVFLFYSSTNQVMVQRILAARSVWDGMMGIIFAGFINFLRPLVTCFLGLIVYHWIDVLHRAPALERGDLAFPFALTTFATSYGLRGVILAGFLAAVMSTISALANSTATIFSLDVYRKFIRPDADERRLVFVGQMASLTALAFSAAACPLVGRMEGVFPYFQQGVTYLSIPFVSVFLMGVFWRRTTREAGIFGLAAGLVAAAGAMGWAAYASEHKLTGPHWLYIAFGAQAVVMAGMAIVSLATPPPAPAQWEPFVWRPSLLAGYGGEAPRPWWQGWRLWFGVYAAVWVGVYIYFW